MDKIITINNISSLKDELKNLSIGDSVILIKSAFSKSEINYNEFCFTLRASDLGGDVICDIGFEQYRMKLTFVEKQPNTPIYSTIIVIGQEKLDAQQKLSFEKTQLAQLQIKKNDVVIATNILIPGEDFRGKITKYPNNKEIELTEVFERLNLLNEKEYYTNSYSKVLIVSKEQIKSKC